MMRAVREGLMASDRRRAFGLLALVTVGLAGLVALENLGSKLLYEILLRLPGSDKAMHWIQYTGLFAILWLAAGAVGATRARRAGLAAVATLAIGFADEFLQGLMARRSFEVADLIVNACGVLAGLALFARPSRAWAATLLTASLAVTGFLGYRTHALLKDFNRGLLHERAREYAEARECYQRAFAAGHRSPGLFNSAAWVEVESGGDPKRAVAYAEQALAWRPHDADVLDTYGWALQYAGESERALPPLLEAYRREPQIYSVHYHLGVVYRALHQPERAAQEFRAQIARLPGSPEARRAAQALQTLPPAGSHQNGP